MYRPYVVTRQERLAFQLSGDKLARELKKPVRVRENEPISKNLLDLHWSTQMKQMLTRA